MCRAERLFTLTLTLALAGVLCACASSNKGAAKAPAIASAAPAAPRSVPLPAAGYALVNRLTWGASTSSLAAFSAQGWPVYLQAQLHPGAQALPADAQRQIDAMRIARTALVPLVQALEQQRKDADSQTDDDSKKAAQQAYQQALNGLQREASSRHLLRALYSSSQVQEQMVWFWLNHFSVFQGKSNLRALVGDYEESAIRPNALGHFRDLLGAVVQHPAMLRYLDNEQNAVGHLNENFARELMELHTLGVDGGYSQADVQELARVLTGVGVNLGSAQPVLKQAWQVLYVRRAGFEFNPARHDFGAKVLLGKPLQGQGLEELNQALDRLASHPATARFVCAKLARFWLADEVPAPLLQGMVAVFEKTHGDMAAVLERLFTAPEFVQAPAGKFKDPMRYVLSSVRLAYDQKVILNTGPLLGWLNRMGEPLYGRLTPDGYPLHASAWASPGQMTTRFEIAKAIGSGSAGLFKAEGPQGQERAAFPQLANALYYQAMAQTLGAATRQALDQAASPQEWNSFLLSAPEMMLR